MIDLNDVVGSRVTESQRPGSGVQWHIAAYPRRPTGCCGRGTPVRKRQEYSLTVNAGSAARSSQLALAFSNSLRRVCAGLPPGAAADPESPPKGATVPEPTLGRAIVRCAVFP